MLYNYSEIIFKNFEVISIVHLLTQNVRKANMSDREKGTYSGSEWAFL